MAKIVIVAGSCNDIVLIDDNRTYDFHTAIDVIKIENGQSKRRLLEQLNTIPDLYWKGIVVLLTQFLLRRKRP